MQRTRKAAYLSGTSQFVMADAANYWSKGSLDAEIKTAYVYAIWDVNGGIVWALGGYSGFTRVPASTTATDDDFFLLEASSTYTKVITDYCVCVGKIRYQYDTADTPDHTIQATVLDAPQVMWNPKSDYGYSKNLATSMSSGSNFTEQVAVSVVVKQSGKYLIVAKSYFTQSGAGGSSQISCLIKTGSATYGSAVYKAYGAQTAYNLPQYDLLGPVAQVITYLNAGDTIHLGVLSELNPQGTQTFVGDDQKIGATSLAFVRVD